MKILVVVPGYATTKARDIYLFAKRWFEAFPDGHEIHFLSIRQNESEFIEGKYPVSAVKLPSKIKIFYYSLTHPTDIINHVGAHGTWLKFQTLGKYLGKLVNKEKYDIISNIFVSAPAYMSIASKRYHKIPVSLTGIGIDVAQIKEINYGATLNKNIKDFNMYCLKHADGLSAISEDAKTNMKNLGATGDIDVTYLGTYTDVQQSKLDSDTIGFIGRFHPRKNIPGLIKIAINVCQNNPNARFLLAGEGPSYLWARNQVFKAQLEKRIKFLGTPHDITHIYPFLSVYLHPSYHEGFGMVNAEAMAHGVPVVTTNTGATPELLGDTNFLFDVHDTEGMTECILNLLADEKKRKLHGQKGRKRILDTFTWEKAAKRMENHLETTISKYTS